MYALLNLEFKQSQYNSYNIIGNHHILRVKDILGMA